MPPSGSYCAADVWAWFRLVRTGCDVIRCPVEDLERELHRRWCSAVAAGEALKVQSRFAPALQRPRGAGDRAHAGSRRARPRVATRTRASIEQASPRKHRRGSGMAIPATQMRPGMIIKHNNDLHSVFSVEHRTPGNLRAFIQAKLRNVRTGAMFEHRFRSGDAIEKIVVDEQEMEYLYNDGDDYYFMDTTNFEQLHLTRDTPGDSVDYLIANLKIKVEFCGGNPGEIELPEPVELRVIKREPALKAAPGSSVTKPAKTETGLVVQ